MESVKPEITHTFTCRVCKLPVSVGPNHRSCQFWVAHCENCGVLVKERLPAITKKIIYLDQFVLSHILAEKEQRWQQVYERLRLLNYLQVIVCPYSEIHEDESLAAEQSRAELKELYRELSHGVRFASIDSIQQTQLLRSLQKFLDQKEDERRYSDFCDEDPNRWELDSQVYADFPTSPHSVSGLQGDKEHLQQVLDTEAELWRQEDGRKFKDDARREALEYGRALMTVYRELDEDHRQVQSMLPEALADVYRQCTGAGRFDPNIPPSTKPGALLVHEMVCEVRKVRPDETDPAAIVEEFLCSDEVIERTPFLVILSRLWAGVTVDSRNPTGQRNPDASDQNDIRCIAHFAQYCDAMVVDNYFRGLATQGNVRVGKDFKVELFSPWSLRKFEDYLDELLHNMPQDHRMAVKKVMPHLSQLPILDTD